MYNDCVWLADMAQGFRSAAKIIDEIIEIKLEIEVTGNTTKKAEKRLRELMHKYCQILEKQKEWDDVRDQ